MALIEGVVAFESLRKHDVYNGQSTGKYMVKVTLDQEAKEQLEAQGVKVSDYKGTPQRKFTTTFEGFKFVDAEGEPFEGALPFGSRVRIQYSLAAPNPVHGMGTYFDAIRVLELAEGGGAGTIDEEF